MSYDELIKLLKTAKSAEEIDKYREEIAELIPQVRRMFDYDQKNHAHQAEIVQDEILYTLYEKGVDLLFEDQMRLVYFVRHHDEHVSLRMKHIRGHLKRVSLDDFKKLMLLQVADAKAHVMLPVIEKRVEICEKLSGSYADYLQEQILSGR